MNTTLSNANIKYINKMVFQLNNYNKSTIDMFFNKANKSIEKLSNEELNSFYNYYLMNIKNSTINTTDKSIISMVKKAERKAKVNRIKDGFDFLYHNISKRLYPSDKVVIKTIGELSFVYFIFLIFTIFLGNPLAMGKQILEVMIMCVGAYSFSRVWFLGGSDSSKKFCDKAQKILMTFLRISFFIGLGEFAIQYIVLKSVFNTIKTIGQIFTKLSQIISHV